MTERSLQLSLVLVGAIAAVASCVTNDVSIERFGAASAGDAGTAGLTGTGGAASASTVGTAGTGSTTSPDASPDVGSPEFDAGQFSRAALLRSFGQCALHTYKAARDRANELSAVFEDPAARVHGEAVATAWASMIDVWQQAELMQFGPAAERSNPGGQDLRFHIYSWPNVSPCSVDEQTVKKAYESGTFSDSIINQRGLAALEYLIFHSEPSNSCSPSLSINRPDRWPALGPEEIEARRLAYARAAARDVLARSSALVDAWEGGNFMSTFTGAGSGSALYPTDQAAFNAVSNAMFYLEKEVKDEKLARPLGKSELCLDPICPEFLESKFAGRSKQHVLNNLVGFKKLLSGCGPGTYGFADLLAAMGAQALADSMRRDLELAIAAGNAIEEANLADALAADRASVESWYQAIRLVTTALKTDFVSVLDLELPAGIPGDND